MVELEQLNLTEKDFDLLVKGLEALPNDNLAGDMFGMMLEGMACKDDPILKEKFKQEREQKKRAEEHRLMILNEDIKILQGKLLMFKRFLIEKSLLTQVNNQINPK